MVASTRTQSFPWVLAWSVQYQIGSITLGSTSSIQSGCIAVHDYHAYLSVEHVDSFGPLFFEYPMLNNAFAVPDHGGVV
jgi:hypothetical protein